jgi:hypothetical protein
VAETLQEDSCEGQKAVHHHLDTQMRLHFFFSMPWPGVHKPPPHPTYYTPYRVMLRCLTRTIGVWVIDKLLTQGAAVTYLKPQLRFEKDLDMLVIPPNSSCSLPVRCLMYATSQPIVLSFHRSLTASGVGPGHQWRQHSSLHRKYNLGLTGTAMEHHRRLLLGLRCTL